MRETGYQWESYGWGKTPGVDAPDQTNTVGADVRTLTWQSPGGERGARFRVRGTRGDRYGQWAAGAKASSSGGGGGNGGGGNPPDDYEPAPPAPSCFTSCSCVAGAATAGEGSQAPDGIEFLSWSPMLQAGSVPRTDGSR